MCIPTTFVLINIKPDYLEESQGGYKSVILYNLCIMEGKTGNCLQKYN